MIIQCCGAFTWLEDLVLAQTDETETCVTCCLLFICQLTYNEAVSKRMGNQAMCMVSKHSRRYFGSFSVYDFFNCYSRFKALNRLSSISTFCLLIEWPLFVKIPIVGNKWLERLFNSVLGNSWSNEWLKMTVLNYPIIILT